MKKTSFITILSVVLISLALAATLFLDDSLGSRIVNIVTIITGVVGAIALFVQFKKDKAVNTASFLMEYSRSFYNGYDLLDTFHELEKHNADKDYKFDYDKYSAKIIAYLEWIESIASLVERGTIDFYTIDNTISYRFFIIVNNPQVQENELVHYAEYWRGTYWLYDNWYRYENKRGLEMPCAETALHLTKGYEENVKKVYKKIAIR